MPIKPNLLSFRQHSPLQTSNQKVSLDDIKRVDVRDATIVLSLSCNTDEIILCLSNAAAIEANNRIKNGKKRQSWVEIRDLQP